jgi:dCMP deaminase
LSDRLVAPIEEQLAERLKLAGSLHEPVYDNLTFTTVEALLDFVTTRWRDRWIINGIWSEKVLESLLRRPFFLLISVDAPIIVRWKRYKAKYELQP